MSSPFTPPLWRRIGQHIHGWRDVARYARKAYDLVRKHGLAAALVAVRRRAQTLGAGYAGWLARFDFDETRDGARLRAAIMQLAARPLISVLMPVYNTPPRLLDEAIRSVARQIYPNWELCIADDCSTEPAVRACLDRWAASDRRIKVVYREENGHISRATQSAFAAATADWIALMDHDDVLAPNALAEVALEIARHPDADIIYSDEDKIDDHGARFSPYFKSDFSLELFRSQNYLNHLTVHRAENIRAVDGWRPGFEGSQDYDLNLRILERIDIRRIRHIPRILYHWRATVGSTALAGSEKGYAFRAGMRALEAHVRRTALPAIVEEVPGTPFYRVRFSVPEPAPLVSLIIPTRDNVDLLRGAVQSIRDRTTYENYEIVIVDNGSVEPETHAYFAALKGADNVRVLDYDRPFNFSAINNFAVAEARGTIVGLINNDVEVISPDWLTEMVSWAVQPDVGCVGAKLYYADDTIQHAGVLLGVGGVANHAHLNLPRESPGYFGRAAVVNNFSSVTGACLVVRKSVYEEVGGLDAGDLTVAFNDIDFCLKVREAGYRNVWTPFAELYHLESKSRGTDDTPEKAQRFAAETDCMKRRWGAALASDPFYSPNLSLHRPDFSLGDRIRRWPIAIRKDERGYTEAEVIDTLDEPSALGRLWRRLSPADWFLFGLLAIGVFVYVGLDLTPSHYALGLSYLGFDEAPLMGQAQPIRSDEWIVLTPLFQIAVHGHFATNDLISPYHETLKGYFALPIADWSLIFKPQLWAFWVLPPAYAYSFYFACLWAAFLAGYAILLRQFGAGRVAACAGAVILLFSHFVQVWWTSNAPTFAFAPLPLIAFLLPARPALKALLVFYGACVWIFGLVYPPFVIPAAFAMAVLILAFRRDVLTIANLAAGVVGVAAAGAAFYLYFGDLLTTMLGTVYPGSRFVGGGGVSGFKLLAHLLPYFNVAGFTPLLSGSNECEIAVVATVLPLALLTFVRYRSLSKIPLSAALWTACGLLLMVGWMELPVPPEVGTVFLWSLVPPNRMAWGLGLLLIVALVAFTARLEFTLSFRRFAIFAAVLAVAWFGSKYVFVTVVGYVSSGRLALLKGSWFDWIGIVPFAALAALSHRWPTVLRPREAILGAAALTGLVTFGTFNPVQRATHFFDIPSTQFLQSVRAKAAANPNGWAVLANDYGALLNGAGIPAINHVLTAPVPDFWKRVFPAMSAERRNQLFNRYAHIVPRQTSEPDVPQADVVVVPMSAFERKVD